MRTCSVTRRESDHGFTILEVLVGLALFAMIMATMVRALDFVSRSRDLTETLLSLSAADDAMRIFERQLAAAAPIPQAEPPHDGLFEGGPDRLSYFASGQVRALGTGVFKFEASFEAAAAGQTPRAEQFILRIHPLDGDAAATAGEAGERYVILDNIKSHSLRYFGKSSMSSAAGWTSEWTRKDEFPELVSIELKVSNGARERQLQSIVELPLRPPSK